MQPNSKEEYWACYDPVCIRDYGTIPMSVSETEFINADFRARDVSVPIPSNGKVLRVLGVKIYASDALQVRFAHFVIDVPKYSVFICPQCR